MGENSSRWLPTCRESLSAVPAGVYFRYIRNPALTSLCAYGVSRRWRSILCHFTPRLRAGLFTVAPFRGSRGTTPTTSQIQIEFAHRLLRAGLNNCVLRTRDRSIAKVNPRNYWRFDLDSVRTIAISLDDRKCLAASVIRVSISARSFAPETRRSG